MKSLRSTHKTKKILWSLWIILLFVIAFEVGGRLAKAQIVYFDEPQGQDTTTVSTKKIADTILSNTEIKSLINRPATAQYPEFKDQLSTTVSPENPKPGQTTTITVSVYSFDINSSEITWKVNGKEVRKGLGLKTFTFSNGEAGQTTIVDVTIDPRDRPVINKTFTFKPGEVDLLWQAEVYTHPFYRGKKLYTPESNVTFVALPRNSKGNIDPNTTVFNWRINDNNQADKSGFGKNSFLFEGPIILRPVKVEVESYTPSKDAGGEKEVASADVTVTPKSSGLVFYENTPLYGVLFNRALRGSITIDKAEMGIAAYPYFQSISNKNTDVLYQWVVDTFPVNVAENQNTITLRRVEAEKGQSIVGVQSQNPFKILQTSATQLLIGFDKQTKTRDNSTNEFGQ